MTTALNLNPALGAVSTKGNLHSAPGSYRKRHEFWLDLGKPGENRIANLITELKEKRSFASAVRDGLRLIVDLRAGRVDVLRALFPSVVAQIEAGARPPDSPVVREFTELMQKQTELLARLVASPEPARLPEPEPLPSLLAAPLPPTQSETLVSQSRDELALSMGALFDDDD